MRASAFLCVLALVPAQDSLEKRRDVGPDLFRSLVETREMRRGVLSGKCREAGPDLVLIGALPALAGPSP